MALPEILAEKTGGLTFGEKAKLKQKGIEFKSLTDIDIQDDAIAHMLEMRGIDVADIEDLPYGDLLEWLNEIFANTFDRKSKSKKK